jgi:5-methylcytosine-specific restriction endonuclease McrA
MELASPSPDDEIPANLPLCKHCDRPFKPRFDRGRRQLHCSDTCRWAYRKASGSEAMAGWKYRNTGSGREQRRLNKRRRRIKAASELRDPSFDRLKTFARDGWRCQLCGQTVQDAHPAAMDSATIRLRVPAQFGGRYSFENSETACRQCNGRAASLVAKSINAPSFSLPRSLRFDETNGAAPSAGPLSSSMESFGSDPATSEAEEPRLLSTSPQSRQDSA